MEFVAFEGEEITDIHLYYRWMPLYSPPEDRYLVVSGISKYSVVSKISIWVSVGQWVSMAITFFLNVGLITLLARLGSVYQKRNDDTWYQGVDSDV